MTGRMKVKDWLLFRVLVPAVRRLCLWKYGVTGDAWWIVLKRWPWRVKRTRMFLFDGHGTEFRLMVQERQFSLMWKAQ